MRIQITGDRDWDDPEIVLETLKSLGPGPHVVVEGEAEGADKQSAWAARDLGHEVEPHPARWYRIDPKTGNQYFFKGAGHERNIEMLEAGRPDIVLAFHNNILKSKGTRHMVIECLIRGLLVHLITLTELGEYCTAILEPEKSSRSLTRREAEGLLHLTVNNYPFKTSSSHAL